MACPGWAGAGWLGLGLAGLGSGWPGWAGAGWIPKSIEILPKKAKQRGLKRGYVTTMEEGMRTIEKITGEGRYATMDNGTVYPVRVIELAQKAVTTHNAQGRRRLRQRIKRVPP